MNTWRTESDVHSFLGIVPSCGRGNCPQVLRYLRQKGVSPVASSAASGSSSGSDTEDAIFPPVVKASSRGVGRGMLLRNYVKDSTEDFPGGRASWDNAVYNQLRRANRQSYTTDEFEYQLKLLHKVQEEREKLGQFEEAAADDASSADASVPCSASVSPSPSPVGSYSVPTKPSEIDGEDEAREVPMTDVSVQQLKPGYKSVRSRNVLLNSLAKMTAMHSSVQEPVPGEQLGTGRDSRACSSLAAMSDDDLADESPLIFDSGASSPQPDVADRNDGFDSDVDDFNQEINLIPVTREELPDCDQFRTKEEVADSLIPLNNATLNDAALKDAFVDPPDAYFRKKIDYPSIVGQYYDKRYSDTTAVNSRNTEYMFNANAKRCKFTPPSRVGLESLGNSPCKGNRYNTDFEFHPEEFPPLK